MFRREKNWITPAGAAPRLCLDMLKQTHLLIAGSSGSGKSVVINSLIFTALYNSPAEIGFILIDPKRVELVQYSELPHTQIYASEPQQITAALDAAIDIMERRYRTMQALRQRESTEKHTYIIIDELADMLTTQKRETLPQLQRLAQLGRAAHLHLIAATQRPTKDILSGQLKVNLDSRIALRCPTAQDSRNIIEVSGAETLPRIGYGYYLTPETMQPVKVPISKIPDSDLAERVQWWITQGSRRKKTLTYIIRRVIISKKRRYTAMKTNIYFLETNAYNAIIFDQETTHYIATEHPDAINNIDLYAPDAAEQLKAYFNELITSNNIDITSIAHPDTIIAGSFTPNTAADIDADKVTLIATFDAESIEDLVNANGL